MKEAHESRNENKRNVYISAAWLPNHDLTTNVYVLNDFLSRSNLYDQSECEINFNNVFFNNEIDLDNWKI